MQCVRKIEDGSKNERLNIVNENMEQSYRVCERVFLSTYINDDTFACAGLYDPLCCALF